MKKIQAIIVLTSILALALIASASITNKALAQTSGPTYALVPTMQIITAQPPVGQQFTIKVELQNITASNVPLGVGGIEVHLGWDNSLIEPVSFTNDITTANGVFNGTTGILYGINMGFYDNNSNVISAAPFTNASSFAVAGASSSGPWWGDNGTIADITFKIDQQPSSGTNVQINITLADLTDAQANEISYDTSNAIVIISTPTTYNETVTVPAGFSYTVSVTTDANATFPTNLDFVNTTSTGPASIDFNVTSGTYANITVPNDFMWGGAANDNWTVMVDNSLAQPAPMITHDSNYAYILVNFTSGTHIVSITSSNVVPEFPVTSMLLALMATTLATAAAATMLRKKRIHF